MVHEPEFEGDTLYSKDGTSIDPDIALSYIGDKVQSILGHFQKDFEGGCSAENLGAKYGGYGSFLPMYHRSQSHVAAQRKSPQRVQTMDMHRSLNHIFPEARLPGAGTPNKHFVPVPAVRPENLRTLIHNDLIREKTHLSPDKISVASPRKVELPSIKSDNGPDNRTLKVRIKVGPNIVSKYNAEIYNLGLASPSSSEGYSSEEYQCESPSKILQMMASAPTAVSLLLSPLSEDLLNLTKEKYFSKKDKCEASPLISDKSSMIFKTKNSKVKSRSVVKSKNFEESETEHKVDLNDLLETNHESEIASCNAPYYKTSSDTIRLSDVNNKVKRMKRSMTDAKEIAELGDSVMGASLENSSQHCFDKYKQQPKSRRSSANTGYPDTSKWKKFKKAVDNTNVGLKVLPHKHGDLGLPRADSLSTDDCKKLKDAHISDLLALKSADGSKGNSYAVPKNKNCRKIDFPPIEKNVVLTGSEQKCSLDKPKKINLEVDKQKAPSAGKKTETSSSRKNLENVTYDEPTLGTPALAVLSNDGTNTGSDQLAAPVLIKEDWVACDHCETWRLLPYGTKSEQLPEKWICSMLDWLPGMNRCDISEDETTKAVQALYQVPICGDQCNNLAHDGRTVSGVLKACAHRLDRNDQNHALGRNAGQLKKLKLKEKLISALNEPVCINNSKKAAQQNALKRGNLAKVNRSITKVNARNDSDSPCPNRLASDGVELKKRKGNHLIKDDETQRKRMKKLSAQHVDGKEEKVKTKSALAAKNFQISAGASDNDDQILKPGLPNRAALNYNKKISVPKAALSGGTGNFKIHIQIQKNQMHDLPNNKSLDVKTGNEGKTTIKKIKLKDYSCSKPQGERTWQNNGSILQDKASNAGSDLIRDKKSLASWIGQEELTQGQTDGKSKGKGYPSNRVENGEHIKKPRAQMRITMEDIDKLKKDMDGEQVPMAAISSSSIVTDSRKKRSYAEMRGSPAESVSSSIARLLSYPNQISPMISETVVSVNHEFDGLPTIIGSANESGNIIPDFRKTNARNKFSDEQSSHTMEGINKDHPQTICRKNSSLLSMDINTIDPFTGVKVFYPKNKSKDETDTDGIYPRQVKMDFDLHQGDKQGERYPGKHSLGSSRSSKKNYLETNPLDTSVADISSKVLKGQTSTSLLNQSDNHLNADAEKCVIFESTPETKKVNGGYCALTKAQGVLKEAEELKSHGDLIKSSGFLSESNYEYLKAALKYLKGASLLEACDAGSGRCLEGDPVQIYGTAAKLFKICAHEYEKYHEMAAAALAYKCMEVAYLRVVSCKNMNTSRSWHDMQSSLQMAPQGESPSSSASDVDNLSNLATATLSKSSGSRPMNHVDAPHSRPNFVRLLDFIQDVNSAMEAAKKSQDTFAASQLNLKESRYKDTIVCIKRVIDFSFQDVQELTRLVGLALNAINHHGLRSQRE